MESENESVTDEPNASGPGAMLRAARESMRLEVAQVAAETRVPARHLEAIEAGQFDALPSRTYAIGFSRTYARMVGLDERHITDLVRAELGDRDTHRPHVGGGMEPGDPAKVPSTGLVWFGAIAGLILAVGAIAFFSTYYGSGAGPASLLAEREDAAAAKPNPAATKPKAADAALNARGQVVLTAQGDGVWVRVYEENGDRLFEDLMDDGDRFELPRTAKDPRINTGRPDLLAITIDGKSVPKLSEQPEVLGDAPVSAAALLARREAEGEAQNTTN